MYILYILYRKQVYARLNKQINLIHFILLSVKHELTIPQYMNIYLNVKSGLFYLYLLVSKKAFSSKWPISGGKFYTTRLCKIILLCWQTFKATSHPIQFNKTLALSAICKCFFHIFIRGSICLFFYNLI